MGPKLKALLAMVFFSSCIPNGSFDTKQVDRDERTSRKASGAPPGGRYPYGILSTDAVSQ